MSKKSDHINSSEKAFLRYSANRMTEKERNAFEKNLQKGAFDSDALEGISAFSSGQIEADLSEMKTSVSRKSRSINRHISYQVAAGIAVLFTISSIFYFMLNRKIDNEQGPLVLTESTNIPIKEKDISEPPIELLDSQEKHNENNPLQKRNLSEVYDEIKKEGNSLQIDTSQSISPEIIAESENAEAFDAEVDSEIKDENFKEESIMASKSAINESAGVTVSYSTQKTKTKKYRGKIVSADDYKPLPGVSIVIKGTTSGTVTDIEGIFEIPANPKQDTSLTLQIDYIGMERQEILADAGTDLNIVLNPSLTSLDEVVVTAYGIKRKMDRTAKSVSSVFESAVPVEGQKMFKKYIDENQRFPETNLEISAVKVALEFLVNDNGLPFNIKVIESPGKEFSDEATRLLENGPKWIAATPSSHLTRINILLFK